MLIERPPRLFRWLVPGGIFRMPAGERKVYLTFDDGPIPEMTPWVLDTLDAFGVKATFFMVGDNVRRHPELLREVRRRGHAVGNHTMHHLQGSKSTVASYLRDVMEADELIGSGLFRPPHGWLRPGQRRRLAGEFRLVMYDLVTRDYSRKLSPDQSAPRLKEALPAALEWLKSEGYAFGKLDDSKIATI